jgi:hypothetical protein
VANPHLPRFRKLCLSLPEATEKEAWGAPTFRVRDKLFAHYRNNHHADGRIAAWCKSVSDVQQDLIRADPERFFKPPYVGPSGWVGVRLDKQANWEIVRDVVTQAYRMTAPKKLRALLDDE